MLKAFILSVFLISLGGTHTTVYLCISKSAEVYHYDRNCRGLSNCTHEIRAVSKDDAINKYGRRECGWED